jgi:predicted nucleotidyltransferase
LLPASSFEKLLTQITDKDLHHEINELLSKKRSGVELGIEPRVNIINNFIENTLQHLQNTVNMFDPKKKPKQELLEEGFISILENNSKTP